MGNFVNSYFVVCFEPSWYAGCFGFLFDSALLPPTLAVGGKKTSIMDIMGG